MTTVILGVGNRLRSDDGIGSLIAEEILRYAQNDKQFFCHSEGALATEESQKRSIREAIVRSDSSASPQNDITFNLIVFDVETTPENYIDKVVEAKPDWVIIVDACNFSVEPGEFKLFEEDEIKEISYGLLSTHTLPLTLTIELIKKQHNCRISLLGIQPKSFTMSTDLSPELLEAKEKIIQFIKKLITE